jgi:hypothetical protein
MGGVERGEHNLTIGSVAAISKGLGMSMSELLVGIEKQSDAPSRSRKPNSVIGPRMRR